LDVKTFLFNRGDEHAPSTEALAPGVPESLADTWTPVTPVTLPQRAVAPDRRRFVADDAIAAADDDVRKALTAQLVAKGDAVEPAAAALALADAKHSELVAVTRAERLIEDGNKDSAGWKAAATKAVIAQRGLQLATARAQELATRIARLKAPPGSRAEADRD